MSSLKRILALLAALLLAGAGLMSISAAAHAKAPAGSISWTVRTALSKYGSNRSKFAYTVKPGEQLTDGIDIANTSAQKITLKVYAADGFTTASGGFDILTPDKPSTGVGAWVKPAAASVTIPAGKEVQVPFTMTVPATVTPGDHLGGIVTVLDQQDAASGGTVIHQRIGLRIETHVTGAVVRHLAIENLKLGFDGTSNPFGTGHATVSYTVHNTGNTALGGLQKVKVAAGFGMSHRTVDAPRLPELLPGESWDVKVPVSDVHALFWVSATATVTPVVTDAAGSTSTLAPISESGRAVVSAWSFVLLIGFVVLIVALVVLLVLGVRRMRKRSKAKVDAKVAAAVQDALKEKDKAGTK